MSDSGKPANQKDPQQPGSDSKPKPPPQQTADPPGTPGGGSASPVPPSSLPAPPDSSAAQQRKDNVKQWGRRLSGAANPDQQEEMRRARDELHIDGSVTGDVVGGDSYGDRYSYTYHYKIFHGRDNAEFRAYRVIPEELEQPFVPPPGFDELAATVRGHRLVAIRGKAGIGKTSALLRALTQVLPDGAPVLRLEPGTDLTSLSCERLPTGAEVVLDEVSNRDAAHLDSFTVERLAAELEQHQCRIGLIVGDDVVLRPALRLAVAELSAGPTPRQVFDQHIAALLVSAPAARARLLDDTEVQKLLSEQLTGSVTLDHAARLATMLAESKDNPAAAAASVRHRMRNDEYEECVQWFRDLPGLREHCMAIALAVLNGLPREVVSLAADRLELLIAPPPDLVGPAPVVDLFAPVSSVPLSVLRAETTSGTTSTATDSVPVMVLRFVHSKYPGLVLRHVWREHDKARAAVVTWLGELGRHGNRSVRVRAATAAGELALDAFDFLCTKIIGVWAEDADPDVRDSAALALGLPASEARVQDAVRATVEGWSAESGLRRATAARTYGESTGLARPTHSLRALAALAEIEDIDVVIAVATSLGEMVKHGTSALVGRVLAEVDDWIGQPNRDRRLTGRLAFLQMTYLRGAPTALRESPGSDKSLPTLLLLAVRDHRLLDQLAQLWSDGVNSADVHTLVLDSLTDWADAVESHPAARTMFVSMLRASARDRRTGAILARVATRWGGDSGSAAKTAESLLANATGVTAYG